MRHTIYRPSLAAVANAKRAGVAERNPIYEGVSFEQLLKSYDNEVRFNFGGSQWEKLHEELLARGCQVGRIRPATEGGVEWDGPRPIPVC